MSPGWAMADAALRRACRMSGTTPVMAWRRYQRRAWRTAFAQLSLRSPRRDRPTATRGYRPAPAGAAQSADDGRGHSSYGLVRRSPDVDRNAVPQPRGHRLLAPHELAPGRGQLVEPARAAAALRPRIRPRRPRQAPPLQPIERVVDAGDRCVGSGHLFDVVMDRDGVGIAVRAAAARPAREVRGVGAAVAI